MPGTSKLSLVLLLFCSSAGCKSLSTSEAKGTVAILGAPPVAPGTYRSVVRVAIGIDNKDAALRATQPISYAYEGSGVRVHKEWILTAAHNVVDAVEPIRQLLIGSGMDGTEDPFPISIDQTFVPEQWAEDDDYDYAFLHVTDPNHFAGPDDISPLSTNGINVNDTLIPVGYGRQLLDDQMSKGIKRAGLVKVKDISSTGAKPIYAVAIDASGQESARVAADANTPINSIAPGDSGGGVFKLNKTTGQLEVAGVNAALLRKTMLNVITNVQSEPFVSFCHQIGLPAEAWAVNSDGSEHGVSPAADSPDQHSIDESDSRAAKDAGSDPHSRDSGSAGARGR